MDTRTQTPDPQWDLAVDIALQLRLHGGHEILIRDCTDQRLVDVRWAVLQAGRMMGLHTSVQLSTPPGEPPTTITATITCTDLHGQASVRARDGLEALLRAVEAEQPVTCTPRVDIPRQGGRRLAVVPAAVG